MPPTVAITPARRNRYSGPARTAKRITSSNDAAWRLRLSPHGSPRQLCACMLDAMREVHHV